MGPTDAPPLRAPRATCSVIGSTPGPQLDIPPARRGPRQIAALVLMVIGGLVCVLLLLGAGLFAYEVNGGRAAALEAAERKVRALEAEKAAGWASLRGGSPAARTNRQVWLQVPQTVTGGGELRFSIVVEEAGERGSK